MGVETPKRLWRCWQFDVVISVAVPELQSDTLCHDEARFLIPNVGSVTKFYFVLIVGNVASLYFFLNVGSGQLGFLF